MRFLFSRTLPLFLIAFSSTAIGQNTALVADGNPGAVLAEGQHVYYTAGDGVFTIYKDSMNQVGFHFSDTENTSWYVTFAAPNEAMLMVQNYPGATVHDTSTPRLDVTVNSSTCGEIVGEFNVLDITYGADGQVESFHATFTLYCDGATGALIGEVLYNSSDPLPPRDRITSPTTAVGTRNHSFAYPIYASNNPTTYTAHGLPPGLALNATSGLISGTPTAEGTDVVSLTAEGADGTAYGTVAITILPAGQSFGTYTGLYMHSERGDPIGHGFTYIYRTDTHSFRPSYVGLTVTDGLFTGSSVDLSVPVGMTLGVGTYINAVFPPTSIDPSLSVIVVSTICSQVVGRFDIDELVTEEFNGVLSSHASYLARCDGSDAAIWGEFWYKSSNAITSDLLAMATLDQPFSYQIIGNNSPTAFDAAPLPTGLGINTATGLISGTPAIGGTFRVPIAATGPETTARSYLDLIVSEMPGDDHPVITGPEEAEGTLGERFNYQIAAGNFTFNHYATSDLPAGLSVNGDTGLITGVPEVAGDFVINLLVTNYAGTTGRFLLLSIYPPTPTITSTRNITAVRYEQFAFQVEATNEPTFYTASGLPIGLTIGAANGLISGSAQNLGTYTANITASNGSGASSQTLIVTVLANASSQLLNLSTRLNVGTGDNVLIGGFIVTGTHSKKVLLRAIGPSLPLRGQLENPVLELHDASGAVVTTNDDWQTNTNKQEIIDTGIPPIDPKESALLLTLDPGAYTAIVSGVDDGTGVGLVEIYDIDQENGSVENISTRGAIGTEDSVLIGGFISDGVVGNVLVRALGPSLAGAGVAGVLSDPVLELYDNQGNLIASNDDWQESQRDQIESTGIPPTDKHESAIFATLPGSAYTAIVRGKDNSTGIGLVETYRLE